jgi:hypothetical protein
VPGETAGTSWEGLFIFQITIWVPIFNELVPRTRFCSHFLSNLWCPGPIPCMMAGIFTRSS